MKRQLNRVFLERSLELWLAVCICLCALLGQASAGNLLYQWEFNGPDGNTVAPIGGSGGVLTMSRITVGSSGTLSAPAAGDFRTTAGLGIFGDSNPQDRAFNNAGAVYGITELDDVGSFAGMVSSDNTGISPAMGNTLTDPTGPHGKITITTWVKLDDGQLNGAFPRLLKFGSQNYDGANSTVGPPTGVVGTYLGFYNFGAKTNTLQFKSNGATGVDNSNGYVGDAGIISPFLSDWMFIAVTYDSTITPISLGTSPPNVKFYIGNKDSEVDAPVSAGALPITGSGGSPNLNTAGPVDLTNNYVYIGNRINGPMDTALGALIDDVRIYDGILTLTELNRVRQNLPVAFPPGDFNLDGVANAADIPVMLQALSDLNVYKTAKGLQDSELLSIGDVNADGALTNTDAQALLSRLIHGQGNLAAVPEPPTAVLSSVAALMLTVLIRRRRES